MRSWLSNYIALLSLAAPVLLSALLLIFSVTSFNDYSHSKITTSATKLNLTIHELVANLQKERGMTVGFLSSQGNSFSAELQKQRGTVDASLEKLNRFAENKDISNIQSALFAPLAQHTSKIQDARRQVQSLSLSNKEAVDVYSAATKALINYTGSLVNFGQSAESRQQLVLLYKLAWLQEKSGLERALLSGVFASKQISDAQSVTLAGNITSQKSILNDLLILSDPDFAEVITAFKASKAVSDIKPYHKAAFSLNSTSSNSPTSEAWFSAASVRIDELSKIKSGLFEDIFEYAHVKSSNAFNFLIVDILLVIILTLLSIAIYSVLRLRNKQSIELKEKINECVSNADMTVRAKLISNDDLGDVVTLVNELIKQFQTDLLEFQKAASNIAEASTESASGAEATKLSVVEQQSKISESLVSAHGIVSAIENDRESIEGLESCTKNAVNLVTEGVSSVSDTVTKIKQTSDKSQRVGTAIETLNERVQDILRMVDVISSVADQTNLLALNAAIEAARAGEHGRGFAVVADEVRSLAKRTQETTEEITHVVENLTSSSKDALTSIEEGRNAANESVVSAEQVNELLDKIEQYMSKLAGLTNDVTSSAETQNLAITRITQDINAVDVSSKDNSDTAEKLARAAQELSKTATSMMQNVERYKVF